jgi:carbonic anhydrase
MMTQNTYCTAENMSAVVALQRLKEGNERYIFEHVEHPHEGAQRRVELSRAQHPFAIFLGCGDSRVVPELIFDQGVGDLFVLRIAGNVADDAVIASIEYAVEHLGTRLVVVLGHEKCGAVTAAISTHQAFAHGPAQGKINNLLSYIEPSVNAVFNLPGNLLTNAIQDHIQRTAQLIQKAEPILAHECNTKNLQVFPAYYHLATGKVEFI